MEKRGLWGREGERASEVRLKRGFLLRSLGFIDWSVSIGLGVIGESRIFGRGSKTLGLESRTPRQESRTFPR